MNSLYEAPIFLSCYDGEEPAADAAAAAAGSTAPVADGVKTFNQDHVNKFLADEKRKTDAKVKQMLAEKQGLVDKLLADKNLSEQDRATLQTEKEALQSQLLTKEEKLKAEKKAVEDNLTAKVKEIEAKAAQWETRYTESSVKRELQEASVKGDACHPEQLVALLKPMTKIEAIKDAAGNPTGEYKTVVEMEETKDGKTQTVQYTPEQAVAAMKALPAQYGNLFKTPAVGVVGGNSAPAFVPGSGQIDWANLTQSQYAELRGKHPNLPAGKRR
jgi:uncharacterized protein YdiU (UPF0061 family)